MRPKITKVCSVCGSEDVKLDAFAAFDVEKQQWELSATFDDAYCESCDGECTIVDKAVVYCNDTQEWGLESNFDNEHCDLCGGECVIPGRKGCITAPQPIMGKKEDHL